MQAVILAAGMGKRLGELTKNNTKCMIKVNGITLIERVLTQLSSLPLTRIIIVIGYKGEELRAFLGNTYNGLAIEYIENKIYDKTNNIYSLSLAKEELQKDDTLLIESDLIFEDSLFRLILDNPYPNLALVDKYETWMDGTMVRLDDENNIVRLDMSEYMEKYSVSRLIGAPPGYVGYDEGGQLTEAVRRKPYSVVLFDEVEKAHPDVFNVLLQVLDDGRITDSQGRTVDFKNTIIIMTSNIGSTYLLDGIDENGGIKPDAENLVMQDLRAHFRPEFLNRLDEIIMFKPLTKANIGNIVDLLIADVNKRLADKELKVELTPEAKEFVVSHGFDPTYGARPLKRYIQKTVETLAAKLILAGNISTGTILIDVDGDKLEARSKGEVQK